ncbi:hypothetical protein [Jiangella gansuensis]|uniref:hypothetical protein n=1 Tax=Jiangella gansuensis TaxID=281473 RepID=UPI000478D58C|nr:hypothetical protein [Jiangella gansuensis]
MSSPALKELLESALAGEPARGVSADAVVARGRARRARRLRRRAGAGVLVITAAAAGLALPSSPVSVVDAEVAQAPTTGGVRADAVLSPAVADDPVKLEMWEAVDDALPSDVRLVEDSYVYGDTPGPGLYLSLERGDVRFSLSVWLQNSRPDLADYRPCTEPEPLMGESSLWSDCEQGADDDGRWRVVGSDDGRDTFLILDGEPAAVALRWGVNYDGAEVDDQGMPLETKTALTEAEADRVADAVWSVGARHTPAELVSGVDLEATSGAAWAQIEAALEEAFGQLTVVEPVDGEVRASAGGVDVQTGLVSATYETADGVRVDVAVAQKDRLYEPMCIERYGECSLFPGAVHAFGTGDPAAGQAASGTLGQRGTLVVRTDAASPELEAAVNRANVAAMQAVPFLGDEPFPLPDEM